MITVSFLSSLSLFEAIMCATAAKSVGLTNFRTEIVGSSVGVRGSLLHVD